MHPDDTIVAQASATGPGARAIVRLSGPRTRACLGRVFTPSDAWPPGRRRVAGVVRLPEFATPIPADVLYFPGPESYTGQNVAEIHLLSSPPIVERLIAALLSAGARAARPGEFTLRRFLAGKLDLPRAEAVLAVIEAGDDVQLRAALSQLAGNVTRPLDGLRDDLLNLLADVEAGLDFADEDISFVHREAAAAVE
jgi:tRNA modification GTPase